MTRYSVSTQSILCLSLFAFSPDSWSVQNGNDYPSHSVQCLRGLSCGWFAQRHFHYRNQVAKEICFKFTNRCKVEKGRGSGAEFCSACRTLVSAELLLSTLQEFPHAVVSGYLWQLVPRISPPTMNTDICK